jgi:hypothetical protein
MSGPIDGPASRDLRSGRRGHRKGWDTRPPPRKGCPLTLLTLPFYLPLAVRKGWAARNNQARS